MQLCSISYNLSKSILSRSKYFSGVFSISCPHSDSLVSVFTANLTCSLSMGLIEQGVVSDRQSNSPITSSFIYIFIYLFIYLFVCLFIYLFIYLFTRNYQHSLLISKYSLFLEFCGVVFWFLQLEKLKWLIQYQTLINDLC